MADIAGRLFRHLTAQNIPLVGLSIGTASNKATWLVQPPELQSTAQPFIDAFDPTDPVQTTAEANAAADALAQSPLAAALLEVVAGAVPSVPLATLRASLVDKLRARVR